VKPAFGDFTAAFWIVTAISALATIWNLRFHPDAGAEISGHPPAASAKAMEPAPRLR
jgi:predicted MFS family arabinose efflux permease